MKASVVILALIILNMFTALGVVHNQYQKRIYGMQTSRIEIEKDQMIDKWSQLLIEYATWSANSRIEKVAKEKLGMRYEFNSYMFLRYR